MPTADNISLARNLAAANNYVQNLPPAFAEIKQKWAMIMGRFEVYAGVEKYADFEQLQIDQKFHRRLDDFMRALIATKLYESQLEKSPKQTEGISKTLHDLLDINLKRLEITQLVKLNEIQKINRDGLSEETKQLKQAEQNINKNIKKQKYSREFNEPPEKPIKDLFLHHEKKFNLREKINTQIEKAQQVETAVKTASPLVKTVFTALKSLADGSIEIMKGLGTAAAALPIVGEAVAGIPALYDAVKAWTKNKSPATKAAATIGAAVTIGALIATGFGAVAVAAVGVVTVAVGVTVKNVIPYIQVRREIAQEKRELEFFQQRAQTTDVSSLDTRDKHILLAKLADAWLSHSTHNEVDRNAMQAAKAAITRGDQSTLSELENNRIFKLALDKAGKGATNFNCHKLLQHEAKQQIEPLQSNIKKLEVKEKDKRWKMVSGILSFVGAILVVIPTPITLGIGLGLIGAGAAVAVANKFNLGEKIGNLWTKAKTFLGVAKKDNVTDVESDIPSNKKISTKSLDQTNAALASTQNETIVPKQKIVGSDALFIQNGLLNRQSAVTITPEAKPAKLEPAREVTQPSPIKTNSATPEADSVDTERVGPRRH